MKKVCLTGCMLVLALTVTFSYAQVGSGITSLKSTPGSQIFMDNCANCHPAGGNILVPDLPLKGSRMLANFKAFLSFIRNPRMPNGSQGTMPSFTKSKISGKQARALYSFLTSSESFSMPGGYGIGRSMNRGYGMGPGMMGNGYGMGRSMMGPGSYGYSPECQKFYDDTSKLRKELHDKRFEYFETLRNPKSTGETVMKLENEMNELQNKIFAIAPLECQW